MASASTPEIVDVVLVVDRSKSMWKNIIYGRTRMDVAKTIVGDLLTLLAEVSERNEIIPRVSVYLFPSQTSSYTGSTYDYLVSRLVTSSAIAKFILGIIESEVSKPLETTPLFKTITELVDNIIRLRRKLRMIIISDAESTEPPIEAKHLISRIVDVIKSTDSKMLFILVNTRTPLSLASLSSLDPRKIRVTQVSTGMVYSRLLRLETLRRALQWLIDYTP